MLKLLAVGSVQPTMTSFSVSIQPANEDKTKIKLSNIGLIRFMTLPVDVAHNNYRQNDLTVFHLISMPICEVLYERGGRIFGNGQIW